MEWFRHDTDAHDDLKIKKLIRMHGAAGYGAYWYLVERIYGNDGLISADDVHDELYLLGIMDEDELQNLMESLLDLDLFHLREDGFWESHRITSEIMNADVLHQKRVESGRKGGISTQARLKESFSVAQANSSKFKHTTQHYTTEQDNTESSSYKNVSHLPSYNNDSLTLADTHKSDSPQEGLSDGGSAQKTFITILSNRGEEIPVSEDLVKMWQQTYPAVNVRQELQRMKSWAISNPTQRKTRQGMTRFIDNWLKKEQDRVKPTTPSYPSGIVADGSDQEKYKTGETIASLLRKQQEARNAAR